MPRGTLSDSLLSCFLSLRRKRSPWKSWTKVRAFSYCFIKCFILAHSVFSVPTRTHAAYQIKALPHNIKKYIFRMNVDPLPPLYEHEGVIGEKLYTPGGTGHA
jgi:hypothetical protein